MFQIETLPYPTLSDWTLYLFDNGEPYILTKRKKTKRERRLRVMFFDHLKTLNYFLYKKITYLQFYNHISTFNWDFELIFYWKINSTKICQWQLGHKNTTIFIWFKLFTKTSIYMEYFRTFSVKYPSLRWYEAFDYFRKIKRWVRFSATRSGRRFHHVVIETGTMGRHWRAKTAREDARHRVCGRADRLEPNDGPHHGVQCAHADQVHWAGAEDLAFDFTSASAQRGNTIIDDDFLK